mmetsp:Transcript_4600/g.9983  ORF Transcript_4600/g.9983 Transcript_4600/m.9983 type:complete len:215 (+) Transcript_4600:65-709(+)
MLFVSLLTLLVLLIMLFPLPPLDFELSPRKLFWLRVQQQSLCPSAHLMVCCSCCWGKQIKKSSISPPRHRRLRRWRPGCRMERSKPLNTDACTAIGNDAPQGRLSFVTLQPAAPLLRNKSEPERGLEWRESRSFVRSQACEAWHPSPPPRAGRRFGHSWRRGITQASHSLSNSYATLQSFSRHIDKAAITIQDMACDERVRHRKHDGMRLFLWQ